MLFVVRFEDVYAERPERLPERGRPVPAHPAFLAEHGAEVVAAGALRPSPDGTPTGGLWIVNAASRDAVEALSRNDPFWKAGLRESVRVSHGAKAFRSPASTDGMDAGGAA